MAENIALDATIDEPSMTADEADMLLFAMERSRAVSARAVDGLVGEDPPQ